MAWVSLCEMGELQENAGKQVDTDGFHLAVFLSEGKVYVMDNYCPHAGGNMSGGWVENGCAVCPWHAWSFGLESGELAGSSGVKIRTYRVRVLDREGGVRLIQADLPIY